MKNPAEIQAFLKELIDSGKPIISTSKSEPTDTDTEVQIAFKRTVGNELTRIVIDNSALNATVPTNGFTNQFPSPQAYVDAFIAFMADGANNVDVVDGVITNTR
jgi:hypothetical protein